MKVGIQVLICPLLWGDLLLKKLKVPIPMFQVWQIVPMNEIVRKFSPTTSRVAVLSKSSKMAKKTVNSNGSLQGLPW